MAKGIEVRGLNALKRTLLGFTPKTRREVQQITEATIRNMQNTAESKAAVDTGKMRQGVSFEIVKGGLGAVLFCSEFYWIYVEFGTGGLVEIPEGFEEFASQFVGKGEKNINLPARPFMIPAWLIHKDKYYDAIDAALGRIFQW